jgi:hypothetical protein
MKQAWRSKDSQYFKNLLVNKVYMEAQNSEKMFIKRLIEQDKGMRKAITKGAAETIETESPAMENLSYSAVELIDKVAMFRSILAKSSASAVMDKYASLLCDYLANLEPEDIEISLGAVKMADEADLDLGIQKLSFLFFGKDDDNVLTVGEIKNDLAVSYLPDRVLYISHGITISQMNTFEMDEETYAQFKKRNNRYFRDLFFHMAKEAGYDATYIEKEADATQELDNDIALAAQDNVIEGHILDVEKVAEAPIEPNPNHEELFTSTDTHPKAYYLFMMKYFGERWLDWDMETLESMLRDNLTIDPGEIAMNKLMSISLILNSDSGFTGYHTFEKVIRSFNNKTVDFDLRESNISLGELVNGMRIMADLIADKDDNLYDNFSDHVFGYIVEVLAAQNYRVCTHTSSGPLEEAFWKLINTELLDYWNKALPDGLFGNEGKGKIENSMLQKLSLAIADQFRGQENLATMRAEAEKRCIAAGLRESAYVEIVLNNALNGLAVDKFIPYINSIRDEQIKRYL